MSCAHGLYAQRKRVCVCVCVCVCVLTEAAVQSLLNPRTENRAYCIISKEGEGPGQDQAKWDQLFAAAQGSAADRSYAQA